MTTMSSSNASIAADVTAELFFDPEVTVSDIHADVDNGRVTLSGVADTYATKWAAERAAYRETGVLSVHNMISVDPKRLGLRSDSDIASSVRTALDWNSSIPAEHLQIAVDNGNVTLMGKVDWNYQRIAAEQAAGAVHGVRSVSSLIEMTPMPVSPMAISEDIQNALTRSARIDAKHVIVKAEGNKVTLSGKLRTWVERNEAVDAAWRAKGVTSVIDNISLSA